jgi:hypothetical protein
MPYPAKQLTGKVFGRLTVLEKYYPETKEKYSQWKVQCRCGKTRVIGTNHLKRAKSCGKCQDELNYPAEYKAWMNMHNRCYNSNYPQYHRYGGRGILVCQEWRMDFLNFYADMGSRPAGLSLDRKDNDKGYNKENCKWSTQQEQVENRACVISTLPCYLKPKGIDKDPAIG